MSKVYVCYKASLGGIKFGESGKPISYCTNLEAFTNQVSLYKNEGREVVHVTWEELFQ